MRNIVFGNSGHAREVEALISLVMDETSLLVNPIEEMQLSIDLQSDNLYLGMGIPERRIEVVNRYRKLSEAMPSLIHPRTYISKNSSIGFGTVVQFGAVVSVEVEVGCGVLLNWNCTIGHDTKIGDGSVINPNSSISGNCEIGSGVLIGSGAVILSGISVGDFARIGAGAVVTKSVEAGSTYVGVPARIKT